MSFLTNYNRVFEFVYNNPGSHFRKIKKELDLSNGTIQYQLNKLEKDGKIVSIHHRFYKFYFPNGVFQEHEIANFLNISYSSVTWHLEQLISYHMIIENRNGKFIRYSMNDDIKYIPAIIKLLKNHY